MNYLEYKEIGIDSNPWFAGGEGLHNTPFLKIDNEPRLIIYTPDIERYCDTLDQAKNIIDRWIRDNGGVEEYRFKADMRIGWNRLKVV